jgi:hypothetical protein
MIRNLFRKATLAGLLIAPAWAPIATAGERAENFDKDPGWEGRNNRPDPREARTIRQDFGFSPTERAGGCAPGEIGGLITPAAEPASYAKVIPEKSLGGKLSASGVFSCDGPVHVLVGFFNAGTVNEWRAPNSIALRIQGRGDTFYAYVEYATKRWRAGADSPRPFAQVRDPESNKEEPAGFSANGETHAWSLSYDPEGNGGRGVITATIDDETSVCNLDEGHKADGATFNRFGLLNVAKSADSPGSLWLDDVALDGELEGFEADPGWEGSGNRRTYETTNIRPRLDFGHSPTRHAGGAAPGELGGLVFRGDCREAVRIACIGDRIGPLALDRPFRAAGKVALRRGVSDSTTLFGFYHSRRSMNVNPSQSSGFPEGFLGFAIEGPSREGFFAYPAYRTAGSDQGYADGDDRPRILPDGAPHDWTLDYTPAASGGGGRITLTFDGKPVHLELPPGDRDPEIRFDRFGLVTTWIDGNAQEIFFDDLTYTASQD